jgi:polysaccharide deacetylase family protein (PEP-CTERM system associated)
MAPTPADDGARRAALTIDVEDWFHAENVRAAVPRRSWERQDLRVERNTERLLELVEGHGIRCTWFVLGWVAERCPRLVRRIADAGHEVASHGYGHDLLDRLSPAAFRDDVERSKALLEDLTGAEVRGYRAPSFSIQDWALPILRDAGFAYDSSFFPAFAHDRYGRISGDLPDGLVEVGVSCLPVGSQLLPWGGGGYFRLLPYPVFRAGVRRILRAGAPYVFYLHPWEIDDGQPRVRGLSKTARFRHYVGVESCFVRLDALLGDFAWSSVERLLGDRVLAGAAR